MAVRYVYKEWDIGFSRLYIHDTDGAVHEHWFTASMTPYLATVLCLVFVADTVTERDRPQSTAPHPRPIKRRLPNVYPDMRNYPRLSASFLQFAERLGTRLGKSPSTTHPRSTAPHP